MSVKLKMYGVQNTTNLHYLLSGLDEPDQHPIRTIIGLQAALDSKYVKPTNGIPASDLEETYISQNELNRVEGIINNLYAKCQIDIKNNTDNININSTDISTNKNSIVNLNNVLNDIKNKLNTIPNKDTVINGSASIHQEVFNATTGNMTFTVSINDTDLKVIHPTVLKDNELYLGNYSVQYPDDTTMTITFTEEGEYIINYISGELTESEYGLLCSYIKKLEEKILKYSGGTILNPAYNIECVYDDNNRLMQEKYTGDVNKTVSYKYDDNSNIIQKTVVQDNVIKTAAYTYDDNGNLIKIIDDGVDIPLDETKAKSYTSEIVYDAKGNIIKQTYTGDINKTVEFTYSPYNDILTKTVTENNVSKTATYVYDSNRRLIKIIDEGTDKIAIVFPSETVGGGTTSTDTSYDITKEDIDLIFENIFKEVI